MKKFVDNLNEILENPEEFIDETEDVALVELHGIMILLGYDEDVKDYYFVLEDDETSEDYYLKDYDGQSLRQVFEFMLLKATNGEL